MKNWIFLVIALLLSNDLYAGLSDCQDLYVGRIRVENGSNGLSSAVFLNNSPSSSGSYWVSFSSWDIESKKSALSMLMAAKLSNQKVNLKTTESNGCNILEGVTTALRIDLASNP